MINRVPERHQLARHQKDARLRAAGPHISKQSVQQASTARLQVWLLSAMCCSVLTFSTYSPWASTLVLKKLAAVPAHKVQQGWHRHSQTRSKPHTKVSGQRPLCAVGAGQEQGQVPPLIRLTSNFALQRCILLLGHLVLLAISGLVQQLCIPGQAGSACHARFGANVQQQQ